MQRIKTCMWVAMAAVVFTVPACSLLKRENHISTQRFDEESAIRAQIAQFSEQYLGMPYRYGGKTPQTSFDCSGFTSYLLGNFECKVSPCSRTQATEGIAIDLDTARPGDLIFFRRSSKSPISHVAMVHSVAEGEINIIHSCSRGILIENVLTSSYWKPKIYFAANVLSSQLLKAKQEASDLAEKNASESVATTESR